MKKKLSITIDEEILKYIDSLIDNKNIKNRSQAIENLVRKSFEEKRKAIILAGGKLSSLKYKGIYKPLVKINGEEIIKHIVKTLIKYGVNEIIILTPITKDFIPILSDIQNIKISYIDDKKAGTAGAIKICEKFINSDFFVVSGDVYFNFDLNKMFLFHKSSGSIATIAVTTTKLNESKDQIEIEGTKVIKFDYASRERTFYINAGVYAMSPEIFKLLPKKGSLEKDVLPKIAKEGKISAYNLSGKWVHIQ